MAHKGRSEDLLWTGAAYRELALWRERYPGGLTTIEESFSEQARRRAGRTRRLRRLAAAALLAAVGAVALASTILWRRAEAARLRAEAGKLVVLGEKELERYPTGAFAYAIASLENRRHRRGAPARAARATARTRRADRPHSRRQRGRRRGRGRRLEPRR